MADESKMTTAEVRHKLQDLLSPDVYHSPFSKRQLLRLTEAHPDIAEEVVREACSKEPDSAEKRIVRMEMYKRGRCKELAMKDARAVVERMTFPPNGMQLQIFGYEWTKEHEEMLIRWLLCERDNFPDTVPINDIWQKIGVEQNWRAELVGSTADICDFPVRFCVYALFKGDWDYFKYIVRGVLLTLGEHSTDAMIRHMRLDYIDALSKKHPEITDQLVRFFAVIHTMNDGLSRQEYAFYGKWIERWVIADKEKFMMILAATGDQDIRKKMMKQYMYQK